MVDELKDMVLPPYPYPEEPVPATVPGDIGESLGEDEESDEEIYSEDESGDEEDSISTESAEDTRGSESATDVSDEGAGGSDFNQSGNSVSQDDSAQEYPCGICHKEVSPEESALLCDTCGDCAIFSVGRLMMKNMMNSRLNMMLMSLYCGIALHVRIKKRRTHRTGCREVCVSCCI